MMRTLSNQGYFLGLVADRKAANLGNMRLIAKVYGDRISKAMPQ